MIFSINTGLTNLSLLQIGLEMSILTEHFKCIALVKIEPKWPLKFKQKHDYKIVSSLLAYKVQWISCCLNYAKMEITLTFHLIYQNYKKISWNSIDKIYTKKASLASTSTSRHLRNLLQAFLQVFLSKLVKSAVIFAFSSSLVLHGALFVSYSTAPYT